MKKINYVGSLTEDLKTIQQNSRYTIIDFIKDKNNWLSLGALGVFVILFIALATKNTTAVCFLTPQIIRVLSEFSDAKDKYKKKRKDAKKKLSEFSTELSENENLYEPLKNSVVLTDTKRDTDNLFSEYVDYVISNIYYINKKDQIVALREVKSTISDKRSSQLIETNLYQLEENELPPRSELPVKQVLKIRY